MRLDKELVNRGLAPTRSKAQELINNNYVLINSHIVNKCAYIVNDTDNIEIVKNDTLKYVSRGGLKLEEAINRFRSYGVLDLQIACIRKFMPFVNRVFVVVSSRTQIPENVKTLKDVIIVTHDEIIPKIYLPCFNSCTIEMFLSKIRGLSEQFLYFNDDVFPIKECKASDFFIDDCICMNYELKSYDEDEASVFHHNIINSTRPFYKENEIEFNAIKPMHSVMPMYKSKCQKVLAEHNKEILDSLTRTRHRKNINAYLFLNYMFKIGKHCQNKLKYEYIELGDSFENIKDDTQILCVNDNDIYYDFENNIKEFREYLNCLISNKKYEVEKEFIEVAFDNTPLKVAVCAIAKNENLYIREWVEWYKNLGVSKIFLYDNNELNGERFEEVINDYIENGFVELIDVRGVEKGCVYDEEGINLQPKCYIDCYENKVNDFDWVCFFDIDEFLSFKKEYNLFGFLNQEIFKDTDTILISWEHYDDNNLLYYDKRPLKIRFPEREKKSKRSKNRRLEWD